MKHRRPPSQYELRRRYACSGLQAWNVGAVQVPPGCPDTMNLIDCAWESLPAVEDHASGCPFCGGRLAMYRRMIADEAPLG